MPLRRWNPQGPAIASRSIAHRLTKSSTSRQHLNSKRAAPQTSSPKPTTSPDPSTQFQPRLGIQKDAPRSWQPGSGFRASGCKHVGVEKTSALPSNFKHDLTTLSNRISKKKNYKKPKSDLRAGPHRHRPVHGKGVHLPRVAAKL